MGTLPKVVNETHLWDAQGWGWKILDQPLLGIKNINIRNYQQGSLSNRFSDNSYIYSRIQDFKHERSTMRPYLFLIHNETRHKVQ